ncbi:MAG TPA: TonB-dependent receptor [Bryobacteraceae bacterium]|nr:TonB-dependent receptor [Bryobacteraceae bacterium]
MFRATILAVLAPGLWAQPNLLDLSLEQLMNIQVRSVSKKAQRLSRTAAAVFVLNAEDIRRSGATNLPDLLRLVPGVQVARLDANAWAISIRGFNARYSNKVLVLIDGRTAYAPDFGGVFWDQQDLPLENIERIEVIRGPGGTAWGANAVNGVINITTTDSRSHSGARLSLVAGSEAPVAAFLEYSAPVHTSGGYRVFGRFTDTADRKLADGTSAGDGWHRQQGGFRTDWKLNGRDTLTLQGDLFHNRAGQRRWSAYALGFPFQSVISQPIEANGGNFLARWTRTRSNLSSFQVQAYYDRFSRADLGVVESVDTLDTDFQYRLPLGTRHDVVWGGGYRVTRSGANSPDPSIFSGPYRTDSLYSLFAQDEISFGSRFSVSFGSRLEHNAYTGLEFEPSLRFAWALTPHETFWASASRAIRQPSRLENSVDVELGRFPVPPGITAIVKMYGNRSLQAEELRDLEIGYRSQVTRRFSLDLTAFTGWYGHLQWTVLGNPQPVTPSEMVIPVMFKNVDHGWMYGAELASTWEATSRWRISPGYAFVGLAATPDSAVARQRTPEPGRQPAKHVVHLRSLFDLTRRTEFDLSLYGTTRLPDAGISGYARLDARINRRFGESTEASIVGQNLLQPRHLEFLDHAGILSSEVPRSIYGKLTWRF